MRGDDTRGAGRRRPEETWSGRGFCGGPSLPLPASGWRAAFTLVELLVVMAVIGVLCALLLPAIASTKRKANDAYCRGNLHQLGIGIRAWADDHEERLPEVGGVTNSSGKINVAAALSPCVRGNTNVFRCREDKQRFQETGSSYDWNAELNGRLLDRPSSLPGQSAAGGATPMLYDHLPWHRHQNAVLLDGRVAPMGR